MHPGVFATLTDRQIAALYGHKRDDKGSLVVPKRRKQAAPPTLAEALMEAERACLAFGVAKAEREALYARVRERFGGSTDGQR